MIDVIDMVSSVVIVTVIVVSIVIVVVVVIVAVVRTRLESLCNQLRQSVSLSVTKVLILPTIRFF